MKTKDLPKIAAGQLADSDCLLADCAAQGTGLVPFAVFSDYHIKRTGVWPSNLNLLKNADFRIPVNRNGKSEYTAAGYTIDRWYKGSGLTMQIKDKTISLICTNTSNRNLDYLLTENLAGQQICLSCLVEYSDTANAMIGIFDSAFNLISSLSIEQGLCYKTLIFSETTKPKYLRIIVSELNKKIEISYIKLELGPVQTLAHQDADGNWVLNDPPNFDLQYALCSQYSPITGEFIGSQHSNPNLLDNWYFADPINQRGLTEYTGTGYTIDRWKNFNTNFKSEVLNNFVRLVPLNKSNGKYIQQVIENPQLYAGKTVTFSALARKGGNAVIGIGLVNAALTETYASAVATNDDFILISATKTLSNNLNTGLAVILGIGNDATINIDTAYIDIIAAKLELGPVQTLAHKEGDIWVLNDPPPNKALELAKCQRYQTAIYTRGSGNALNYGHIGKIFTGPNEGNVAILILSLPTTMRGINPQISVLGQIRLLHIGQSTTFATLTSATVYNATDNCVAITCEFDKILPANSIFEIRGAGSQCGFLIDENL